jgi:peroxiredoxin
LAEYRDRQGELRSLGLGLAAISVDAPERSRALAEQLGLGFPLLSDTAREVVRAYGVFNRKEKGGIAYPATFVLDRQRTVRFRSLDRTASRVDLDQLFAFLRGGLDGSPLTSPKRCAVVPSLRDFARVTKNALRFGVRSPFGRG